MEEEQFVRVDLVGFRRTVWLRVLKSVPLAYVCNAHCAKRLTGGIVKGRAT